MCENYVHYVRNYKLFEIQGVTKYWPRLYIEPSAIVPSTTRKTRPVNFQIVQCAGANISPCLEISILTHPNARNTLIISFPIAY